MHGSTATYTAYRRDTPKLLWIHHPYVKHSTQTLTFSCEKEGRKMGQLSNYTACLCVIKETCSVWSPGRRATAPLAQGWHSWWLQGWTISQEAPLPLLLEVPVSAEASNTHCKNARGLQPAELCTLTLNTCFPILLVCFLKQCCWRRATRTTEWDIFLNHSITHSINRLT